MGMSRESCPVSRGPSRGDFSTTQVSSKDGPLGLDNFLVTCPLARTTKNHRHGRAEPLGGCLRRLALDRIRLHWNAACQLWLALLCPTAGALHSAARPHRSAASEPPRGWSAGCHGLVLSRSASAECLFLLVDACVSLQRASKGTASVGASPQDSKRREPAGGERERVFLPANNDSRHRVRTTRSRTRSLSRARAHAHTH